jgi:hypothetical protein
MSWRQEIHFDMKIEIRGLKLDQLNRKKQILFRIANSALYHIYKRKDTRALARYHAHLQCSNINAAHNEAEGSSWSSMNYEPKSTNDPILEFHKHFLKQHSSWVLQHFIVAPMTAYCGVCNIFKQSCLLQRCAVCTTHKAGPWRARGGSVDDEVFLDLRE